MTAPASRHRAWWGQAAGCSGGEEQEAQDSLPAPHPAPSRDASSPGLAKAGVPQEAQVLIRELVSPKVPDQ